MGKALINKEKKLTQRPIIMLALACFSLALIFGTEPFSSSGIMYMLCIAFGAIAVTFFQSDKEEPIKYTAIKAAGGAAIIIIAYCIISMRNSDTMIFLIALFLAVIYAVYCYLNEKLDTKKILILLFILAFALRLTYIAYTEITLRQHDVEEFSSDASGHAAYILYIFENWSLPDFDVREHWQFYHPPLHHFICAVWLKIQQFLGIETEASYEGMQFLTLFYSSLSLYLSYRIMQELRLRRTGLIVAFAIVAFHPTFIILSGSVNNDILSVAFMLGAILNTIIWYRNRSFKNIFKIALCIGLGMFTKLSVWMVAPAVAFVFLIALIKNSGKLKSLIGQMLGFGAVCVPLGLGWSIRNYLAYGVPFTYVPKLSETNSQYVGYHSVLERLFDFNLSQFESVYTQFEFHGGKYFEYNPTIGLLKTAMFDEITVNLNYYPQFKYVVYPLFWIGAILALLGVVAIVVMLIRKNSMKSIYKGFFALLFAVILGSYYVFCFEFPFTCTQNARYVVPLIVVGAMFIGLWITKTLGKNTKPAKAFRISVCALTVCFCVFSSLMYTMLGI